MENLITKPIVNLESEAMRYEHLLADWQARVQREGTAWIKTDLIWAWSKFDRNSYFVEGMARAGESIYRAFFRVDTLNYEDLLKAFTQTEPHTRPARLGDIFNGFFNTCTVAFFLDYCRRFCLDADELYAQAFSDIEYMRLSGEDQEYILDKANWEGIEYPEFWGSSEVRLLQKMLTNCNYHSLRDEIEILEEIGVYQGCQIIPQQPSLLTLTSSPMQSA